MLYEQENTDDQYYKDLIVTKLAYERCERYISCARALIHMSDNEIDEERRIFKNLWHILDLVSIEINALTEQLDEE